MNKKFWYIAYNWETGETVISKGQTETASRLGLTKSAFNQLLRIPNRISDEGWQVEVNAYQD